MEKLACVQQSLTGRLKIPGTERWRDTPLCVKEIFVDGGRMLKRIQPAPQGRAHRIRKRSNHVTIVVDKMVTRKKSKQWDKK